MKNTNQFSNNSPNSFWFISTHPLLNHRKCNPNWNSVQPRVLTQISPLPRISENAREINTVIVPRSNAWIPKHHREVEEIWIRAHWAHQHFIQIGGTAIRDRQPIGVQPNSLQNRFRNSPNISETRQTRQVGEKDFGFRWPYDGNSRANECYKAGYHCSELCGGGSSVVVQFQKREWKCFCWHNEPFQHGGWWFEDKVDERHQRV